MYRNLCTLLYVPNMRILSKSQSRHRRLVRQLEIMLDKIYASDAIKGYAASMFKRIVRDNICVRCRWRALAIAVTTISCKMHGKIINLCDIIENASEKKIYRIYKNPIFELKINLNASTYIKSIITKICSPSNPKGFLKTYCCTQMQPWQTPIRPE